MTHIRLTAMHLWAACVMFWPMVAPAADEVRFSAEEPPSPGQVWPAVASSEVLFGRSTATDLATAATTPIAAVSEPLQKMDWQRVFTRTDGLAAEPRDPAASTGVRNPYVGSAIRVPFHWAARNAVHRTLYFQDLALERYGQSRRPCVQPFTSAGVFAADFLLVPLRIVHDPPCELHYTLGLKRPGSAAPQVRERCCGR